MENTHFKKDIATGRIRRYIMIHDKRLGYGVVKKLQNKMNGQKKQGGYPPCFCNNYFDRENYMNGTIISATMLMILINGFTAGPAVSLYGSPTVSPVTAAL